MTARTRAWFTVALLAELVGGGAAALVAGRPWQTVRAPRPRPLLDDVLAVSGRTLQPAVTALAVVALVGAVAVLATRGLARRAVGVLLVAAGAGLTWRAVAGFAAVGPSRARSLLTDAGTGVGLDPTVSPAVTVHAAWPALAALAGLIVIAGGILVAARGHTWTGLSTRYEAPTAAARAERAQTDAGLWSALDRGADPTADPTADPAAHPAADSTRPAPGDPAAPGIRTEP